MASEIRLRRGTAAAWATTSEILDEGEPGYDTTNRILKIGDGVNRWPQLPAMGGNGGGSGLVTSGGITDATPLGRELLTAPDPATARAAINAPEDDLPSLVLIFENGLV